MPATFRSVLGATLGLCMRVVPFRFSKDFRHAQPGTWRSVIYKCVDVVAANMVAGHCVWEDQTQPYKASWREMAFCTYINPDNI